MHNNNYTASELRPTSLGELAGRMLEQCHKDEHGCLIWPKKIHHTGYGVLQYGTKEWAAHRVIWELTKSSIPEGVLLDHICHNRACVNPDHLRLATPAQNVAHRSGPNKGSHSGVRNVYWSRGSQKWTVLIVSKGVRYNGGVFADLDDARECAAKLREQVYGDYAGKG